MSEETLQIAENRREAKDIGEKERCTQQNAEFQIIARRDKKAFLSEQCKEAEENNKLGKTSDPFWRRQWHPTPVFLPGEFYKQRSLVGYSGLQSWGCKELDMTE